MSARRGPGLAKTRGAKLVSTRAVLRVRADEPFWRAALDAADVVSEGATQAAVGGGSTWFGSTSFLVPLDPHAAAEHHPFLVALLERDLHLRLRALRVAHREATLRAPQPLGVSRCEIRVERAAAGLRIDVDLEAPLMDARRAAHPEHPSPR